MENTVDGKTVLRRSSTGWLGPLVTALLLLSLSFGFAILGVALILAENWRIGLIVLVLTVWIFLLGNYVWRDFQAKRLWRVEIEPGEIFMDLPVDRSMTQPLQRIRQLVELSHIACVETRLEAYRFFGAVNMQRSYGLRMKSGELIVLGEDRALATRVADHTMAQMVDTIMLKTGLPLRDMGMVEGKSGFLGLLFTSIPPWGTPGLPGVRQAEMWRRVVLTGGITGAAIIAGLILAAAL